MRYSTYVDFSNDEFEYQWVLSQLGKNKGNTTPLLGEAYDLIKKENDKEKKRLQEWLESSEALVTKLQT